MFDTIDKLNFPGNKCPRMAKFEIEYWSSLDNKYIILEIEADSEAAAVKLFKAMHPHKKYRVLAPLDD